MNRLSYNLSLLVALVLIGAGSAGQWGWSVAAIVLGFLIIALTFAGIRLTMPRNKE
jgi:hypothetical protein